jgi:hypothetical protein
MFVMKVIFHEGEGKDLNEIRNKNNQGKKGQIGNGKKSEFNKIHKDV